VLEIIDQQRISTLEAARAAIVRKWPSLATRETDTGAEPLGIDDDASQN
jgi:hypothetical protein